MLVVGERLRVNGLSSLGQASAPGDMDHVVTYVELDQNLGITSLDGALDLFKFCTHAAALRAKCAYMSGIAAAIDQSLDLRQALYSTPEGQGLLAGIKSGTAFFLGMTQPNILKNLTITRNYLRDIALPKFGQGVKGIVPEYSGGDIVSVAIDSGANPQVTTIFDFGDLTSTTFKAHVDQIKASQEALGVKAMGEALLIAIVVLVIAWMAASVIENVYLTKINADKIPEPPPTATPEERQAYNNAKARIAEANSKGWTDKATDVLMWIAIVAVALGGTYAAFRLIGTGDSL
jgi:hypothetical protein